MVISGSARRAEGRRPEARRVEPENTISISTWNISFSVAWRLFLLTRDATFRKMTNRNQTDTNEMATTETKYQTDFYSAEKYQD